MGDTNRSEVVKPVEYSARKGGSVFDIDDGHSDGLVGVVGAERDPPATIGRLGDDILRDDHTRVGSVSHASRSSACQMPCSSAAHSSPHSGHSKVSPGASLWMRAPQWSHGSGRSASELFRFIVFPTSTHIHLYPSHSCPQGAGGQLAQGARGGVVRWVRDVQSLAFETDDRCNGVQTTFLRQKNHTCLIHGFVS